MKIAFFSAQNYEKNFFQAANEAHQHELECFDTHLQKQTVKLAEGFEVVCCFVNDCLSAEVLKELAAGGTTLITLRSAGFNHVDLEAAKRLKLTVARVPAYSPYAVAEHAVGLILALNRKIHRAYHRVRECDFSLHGLMGFDLKSCTVGIIGTGKIGSVFAKIMHGFSCELLAADPIQNEMCLKLGVSYVSLDQLYQQADIISLHCPLTTDAQHLIDQKAIAQMKPGVMIINTGRGALIDTKAVIQGLKKQHIGYLGLDVYEEEGDLFFEDLSDQILQDDLFARLQTFPNVIITGHQAFFTEQAMRNIAETTLANVTAFASGQGELYRVE